MALEKMNHLGRNARIAAARLLDEIQTFSSRHLGGGGEDGLYLIPSLRVHHSNWPGFGSSSVELVYNRRSLTCRCRFIGLTGPKLGFQPGASEGPLALHCTH